MLLLTYSIFGDWHRVLQLSELLMALSRMSFQQPRPPLHPEVLALTREREGLRL